MLFKQLLALLQLLSLLMKLTGEHPTRSAKGSTPSTYLTENFRGDIDSPKMESKDLPTFLGHSFRPAMDEEICLLWNR